MAAADLGATAASAADGSAQPAGDEHRGRLARRIVVGLWAVILALLLRHREIISSDTLSNYIHVWYVAERLSAGHGVPFHMNVLAHGDALAFPYAFIPWMFAALLWPMLGEWSVTFALGLGWFLMVGATFWAFPELRKGWWAVAVLVNPAFVEGLLLGQLPFMWASAMLLGAIGCWRRERRNWAMVLAALAQITHAAVLMPIVAVLVLVRARYEPRRKELIVRWLVTVVVSLPAAWFVVASPVTAETSKLVSAWIELETVALRSLVIAVPFGLLALQRRERQEAVPYVVVALLAYQLVTAPWSSMKVGWGALVRTPDAAAAAAPHARTFEPGKTYRVLSQADGKYAPYAVVRAGGRLDSEFFPESLYWRSFDDDKAYARFLTDRQVDFVIYYHRYTKRKTNEEALLKKIAADGTCASGVQVKEVERESAFDVYAVTRGC